MSLLANIHDDDVVDVDDDDKIIAWCKAHGCGENVTQVKAGASLQLLGNEQVLYVIV